jgi:hypothetical protein
MPGPGGKQNTPFGGVYVEIVPNRKIVYDNAFETPTEASCPSARTTPSSTNGAGRHEGPSPRECQTTASKSWINEAITPLRSAFATAREHAGIDDTGA